jgi:predicted transposase/invertase (TIGR01784 family)
LIETVVVYKFPQMTREEIEKMLQVNDFRETRVYQEALEEGAVKAIDVVARRMLAKGVSESEIAEFTGLSVADIRRLKKKPAK